MKLYSAPNFPSPPISPISERWLGRELFASWNVIELDRYTKILENSNKKSGTDLFSTRTLFTYLPLRLGWEGFSRQGGMRHRANVITHCSLKSNGSPSGGDPTRRQEKESWN